MSSSDDRLALAEVVADGAGGADKCFNHEGGFPPASVWQDIRRTALPQARRPLLHPRADHAQAFAEEICVHTKDRWARRPYILATWQRDDIVRPLFGEVRWDDEAHCYVLRFRIAWIELARKNGKSELLAFVALYLLVGDGVESAEIYGCARDIDQAKLVFNVAARMGPGLRAS